MTECATTLEKTNFNNNKELVNKYKFLDEESEQSQFSGHQKNLKTWTKSNKVKEMDGFR